MPRPKVWSSVVRLERKRADFGVKDERLFFDIVRASFSQRRKTLANGLGPLFGSKLTKEKIIQTITELGFDERLRGETLGIDEFARLAEGFSKIL